MQAYNRNEDASEQNAHLFTAFGAWVSPSPAHHLAHCARRPTVSRLALEESLAFLGKRAGGGLSSRWRFFEALQAYRFEIGRNVCFKPARGGRLGLQHVDHRGHRRGPPEWRPASHQFVEHGAE